MKAVVQNETRVVLALQKDGQHENIVQILKHGWLGSPHNYFFIDMDLCASNLHDYIYGERSIPVDSDMQCSLKNPAYVSRDGSLLVKMRNVWTIMSHLANGLKFIHSQKQVHRDIKPRNG